MSAEDSSSPSRLRARLDVARSEAIHQKATELQTYLSGRGIDASTLVPGDLNAFYNLALSNGAPTIDLNAAPDVFNKQLSELGTFVQELMPAVRYLNAFSTAVGIVQRSDAEAFEEFKQTLARLTDDVGFEVGTLRDGRSLLSYTNNEQIAKLLLESETIKATLDNSLAYLVAQSAPSAVVRAVVEAGAKITNDAITNGESVLALAVSNYSDIELLKLLVSKASTENINYTRPTCGYSIARTAVMNGAFDRLQVLVEAGADLFFSDWYSTTFQLLMTQSSETIKTIFEMESVKKAIIEAEPYSIAFYNNSGVNADNLRLLKAIGADVNPSMDVINAKGRYPALYSIVSNGDINSARVMIELGADAKIVYMDQTLLFVATSAEMAQLLIDNGADAKYKNSSDATALMNAFCRYNDDLLRTLITVSDISAVNLNGQTALHLAVGYSASTVRVFLETEAGKALLNVKDGNGHTPLHTASNSDIVGALLESGDLTALSILNNEQRTPLLQALASWNTSAVIALLEKTTDLTAVDATGRSALFYAVSTTNIDVVNSMLEKGAPIDLVDTEGSTILLTYLSTTSVALDATLLKRLVDGTTDVNAARKADNFTPLLALVNHRAGYSNFAECVDILLPRIADLTTISDSSNQNLFGYMMRNASGAGEWFVPLATKLFEALKAKGDAEVLKYFLQTNSSDETALHYAAYRGSEESDDYNKLLVALLDAFPQLLNEPHPTSQRTPLHIAAAGNNPGGERILIARGADILKVDKDGIAPIDSCTQRSTLEPLVNAGAKINPTKFNVVGMADDAIEVLKDQLEAVPPSIRVIMGAIEKYSTEDTYIVRLAKKYLEEKLVDINEEVDGNTPLIRLSYAGNNVGDYQYEWIKILLSAGADVKKARADGATPLMEAIRGSNRGALDLLLAHADIDVNVVDATGQTPLTCIAINGKATDICQMVLDKGADKAKPNAEGKLPQDLTTDESLLGLLRVATAAPEAAAPEATPAPAA